ncbi:MAG: glutamine synthetase [Dehalococcoidia bacterium]|nr:glutamine synthetase [Dehalococcoidia bacterium]
MDYVLHTARENDVRFIRLWFTDILGNLKGFAITVEELQEALESGVAFDGSSIQGFARVDESDMIALPDPTTFRILPWRPKENAVARIFCDVLTPDGQPFQGDPRQVLRRNLEQANRMGFTFYVGPELEYFYFKDSASPVPLDHGDYFDQTPSDMVTDLRRETVLTLAEMGIPVTYSHHEAAPSQHEIDLQYADALSMADNVMTARLVVKEIAAREGVYATFMPKPLAGANGSGMHINLSLFRKDRNLFYDQNAPLYLSNMARSFIAGLIKHAAEITLVTNQWVNSYKRLVPGYEAPVYVSWASINRSDLIRVPAFRAGREDGVRIEYRAPDPACNPYLAFSVLLAAGLDGVEKELPAPPSVEENVAAMTDTERRERNIGSLPRGLHQAIDLAEGSELLRKALGEHAFQSLLNSKRIEWERYRSQVTDYEIKYYLPML